MVKTFVTGDETWIHHYQPMLKQASVLWKLPLLPSKSKLKDVLTVFWDSQGVLLAHFLKQGETVKMLTLTVTL